MKHYTVLASASLLLVAFASPSLASWQCPNSNHAKASCNKVLTAAQDYGQDLLTCLKELNAEYNDWNSPGKGPKYRAKKLECYGYLMKVQEKFPLTMDDDPERKQALRDIRAIRKGLTSEGRYEPVWAPEPK